MFMPVEGRGGGGGRPMCCAGADAGWRGGGGSWYMANGRCALSALSYLSYGSCWGSATVCALLRGLAESGSSWRRSAGTLRLACGVGRGAGGARRALRSGSVEDGCERYDDWERWRGAMVIACGRFYGSMPAVQEPESLRAASPHEGLLRSPGTSRQILPGSWEAPCSLRPVRLGMARWVAEWVRG